jgi:lambda family phage tail tape measure protein
LSQLDILAETNPALATHIALLRERAVELDAATQKQADAANSFGVNFTASFKSYYDSIANLGAQVGDAVVNTFKGLEDQLVNFVTTGKASFADLAKSIIADIARIAIKQAIIKPLMAGVGDLFNIKLSAKGSVYAENGIQPFARGGIVDKPTLFPFAKGIGLMGEAGPEAIIPLRRGRDGNLGVAGGASSSSSTSVVVNVDATGSKVEGNAPRGDQLGKALSAAVQAELIKQRRPGGLLA